MKVSENTTGAPFATAAPIWPNRRQPIAPWWHTAILASVIVGISILSGLQSKAAGFGGSHIARYAITIAWEWVLALLAWWGLWMRRTPLRQILGQRRTGIKEWARDIGIALLFWIMAMLVLAAIATVLRMFHLIQAQKAIIAIAPQSIAEILRLDRALRHRRHRRRVCLSRLPAPAVLFASRQCMDRRRGILAALRRRAWIRRHRRNDRHHRVWSDVLRSRNPSSEFARRHDGACMARFDHRNRRSQSQNILI